MEILPDAVYILRKTIHGNTAPHSDYRELAARALSGLDLELPKEGSVLLKPNATVLYEPDMRIITHPGFLLGIIDALGRKGISPERIIVGDGQSGENKKHNHTWETAGYRQAVDEAGVTLAVLNDSDSTEVDVPGGVVFSAYPFAREVTDCSFFFNVPLAKCHNLGCTTLSIKNLMGVLLKPERHLCRTQKVDESFDEADLSRLTESGLSLFEDRFYHKLCDLLAAFRSLGIPRLNIVDGLIGRDGTAFNQGENNPLGWTLVGRNEVHVDAVGTYLMGLDPEETPYLKFASDRGLGSNRIADIDLIDLKSAEVLDPVAIRSDRVFMPTCRREGGYYNRFRKDGSVVPWKIDDVNRQRKEDGLPLVPVE
jgi:uncharacterized protein (DUF362 family)